MRSPKEDPGRLHNEDLGIRRSPAPLRTRHRARPDGAARQTAGRGHDPGRALHGYPGRIRTSLLPGRLGGRLGRLLLRRMAAHQRLDGPAQEAGPVCLRAVHQRIRRTRMPPPRPDGRQRIAGRLPAGNPRLRFEHVRGQAHREHRLLRRKRPARRRRAGRQVSSGLGKRSQRTRRKRSGRRRTRSPPGQPALQPVRRALQRHDRNLEPTEAGGAALDRRRNGLARRTGRSARQPHRGELARDAGRRRARVHVGPLSPDTTRATRPTAAPTSRSTTTTTAAKAASPAPPATRAAPVRTGLRPERIRRRDRPDGRQLRNLGRPENLGDRARLGQLQHRRGLLPEPLPERPGAAVLQQRGSAGAAGQEREDGRATSTSPWESEAAPKAPKPSTRTGTAACR